MEYTSCRNEQHYKGSREVLEAATRLCASDSADERQLGANILSQLGMPDRTLPDECFEILAAMLTKETDPNVLECIGVAFGHRESSIDASTTSGRSWPVSPHATP
jgi:hypothetical protein